MKSFLAFTEATANPDRCCVMAYPSNETLATLNGIVGPFQNYLDNTGLLIENENDYHVTVFYGLIDDIPSAVGTIAKSELKQFKIKLVVDDVSLFHNDEADVIKLSFKKNLGLAKLQALHNKIKNLPNDNKFPDYQAHLTIAYVQPGKGESLITEELRNEIIGQNLIFDSLVHSGLMKNGHRSYITL